MAFHHSDSYLSLEGRDKKPLSWGGKVAIITAGAAIVLFALAVVLGNYLRSRAEPEESGTLPATESAAAAEFAPSPTLTVIRRPFAAAGEVTVTEPESGTETGPGSAPLPDTDREAEAEEKLGCNAVSLLLRDRNADRTGAVRYFTATAADRFGAEEVADGARELGDGIRRFRVGGEYVSTVFYLGFPTEPAETRSVLREYELALIREAAQSGADEIILFGDWTGSGELREVFDFCAQVSGEGNVRLGVALNCEFLLAPDAPEQLNQLSAVSGGVFLALDLRSLSVPALMSAEEIVEDRVTRTSDLVLRYAMRVLVGCGENPDYPGQMLCARAAGALSVQSVG